MYGVILWEKFVECISCCCTKTMHCFTYVLSLKIYKQFVNGVFFDIKEYVKMLLYGPLNSVLKGGTCSYSSQHSIEKAV